MRTLALASLLLFSTGSAAELRDPMRPRYEIPAVVRHRLLHPGALQLQAIFGDAKYRVAIINGQPVEIGAHLGPVTVLGISADRVLVKNRAKSWSIVLPSRQ